MIEQENQLGDLKSGLEWITGNGQEHRAHRAIQQGDFEKARRLLEPVAARNSIYSLLTLGGFYEWGNLGPPDLNVAISYYQRAASQGSVEACQRLGRLLLEQREEKEARAAFLRGAEAGNISCMFWLGEMMVKGEGGALELDRGCKWLEAAAAQGQFYARRRLLVLERRKAVSLFRKLLIQGCILALTKDFVTQLWKDADSDKVR